MQMKNNPIKFLFLFTVSLCVIQSYAQDKLSINNVYKMSVRSAGTIISDDQIKGYFLFFKSDKIDRRTNEYTLQIVDANLNKVKDIKFQDSKKIYLLESSYNGSALVFMFYDDDQNMLDYRLYDLDGKQSYTYSKVLDKRSENYFKSSPNIGDDEESENQNIFDVKDKGFVSIIKVREGKKYTYEVNYYASDKKRNWTYNPIEDGKFTDAHYLGANDSIALIEVLSKDKMTSKEVESTLLGVNLSNGRKAFEINTIEKGNKLYPMNISTLQGNNGYLVMGPYFENDDRILKDKSLGFGVWVMDNKGKILTSKYISWQRDIGKYLKTDQKGRIEDIGYVYFHNVLQTADGKVFAIGEGYKKVASALGIASTALSIMAGGGGSRISTAKMKVTDMFMLQLDDKFNLQNALIYEKYNNNIELPSGSEFYSPHTLAMLLKISGSFDYSFTQLGKNKSSFVTAYTDYEKGKDYKGLTFNSISYYDGKITQDKINLKTSAKWLSVYPAKPGSVMIMEYFKKDRRLDMHMEKIN